MSNFWSDSTPLPTGRSTAAVSSPSPAVAGFSLPGGGWEEGAGSPLPAGSTTIEIDLVPEGDGTTVRFTHRDLPTEDAAERHAHGWGHYLGRLATVAGGGDPGRDPWLDGGMRG